MRLNSKNYDFVSVEIRGEAEPIKMPLDNGLKLMNFLTESNANHVQITDTDGEIVVVRTTDIIRALPVKKSGDVSEYV